MMNRKTYRIVVHGLVQGVGYRNWTAKTAMSLKLNGTVKNNVDGSVEICTTCNEQEIKELLTRCKKGPMLASVSSLDLEEITAFEFEQFLILK